MEKDEIIQEETTIEDGIDLIFDHRACYEYLFSLIQSVHWLSLFTLRRCVMHLLHHDLAELSV